MPETESKIKLICFDVDGTLVDGISWLFLTRGLGCSSEEHIGIFNRAKCGEITFAEGERMLTRMYRDSGNATRVFIENLFARVRPRPEAKQLVSYLKKKGYLVYLISGAIDIYVRAIAKRLGADGYFANSSFDFDKSGVLEKIHYRDNQGEVKVEQLKQLIKARGIRMNEVVFVGDSENDIEIFEATKKGIAVSWASDNLKEVAWKIINSLGEIKKFL
ncbi:HAD-IB family phosphatase [Candidatus Shapirobacteria bacterium]|nr:HAD-IB family phosphatase [Candidatus Shapirobacteria bacterium]